MSNPTKDEILEALTDIKIPELDLDITADDVVSSLSLNQTANGFEVRLVLEIEPHYTQEQLTQITLNIEEALKKLGATVIPIVMLTTHVQAPDMAKKAAHKAAAQPRAEPSKPEMPKGVKTIIAVASAKGGVGKSTTAVNLALSLAHHYGLKVGLMDADIQTPSVHRLLGLRGEIEETEDGMMRPHEAYGIMAMSMGLLIPDGKAAIWRGPVVHGALRQMLHGVAWGDRDVLVLDMPPGTGDVPLSVTHHAPLSGAVIVSTPQDLALIDARRGIEMFGKMNIPVWGMIENMSFFECPHCKEHSHIFGHGGAEQDAHRHNIPFLGRMPLDMDLRETSDAGMPIVAKTPHGTHSMLYKDMAGAIRNMMQLPAPV